MKYEFSDSISVVIPAKNEELSIREVIVRVQNFSNDVILIDGHSTDQTAKIARELGVRVVSDNKKGKGDAIRCSIERIKNDITVFIDADLSHLPEDIPRLVAPILNNECDHVTGSRLIGGSSELHGGFDEWLRLSGSSFITACINKRFGVKLSDSQNGFRSIRTAVLRELNLKENITTIEQEMIIKTLRLGYKMGEVPTHEYKRKYGNSCIDIKKVWFRYVYSMIKNLVGHQN